MDTYDNVILFPGVKQVVGPKPIDSSLQDAILQALVKGEPNFDDETFKVYIDQCHQFIEENKSNGSLVLLCVDHENDEINALWPGYLNSIDLIGALEYAKLSLHQTLSLQLGFEAVCQEQPTQDE